MEPGRIPLRCPSNHYGYALDATGTYEVRCRSKHCRTAEGFGVIHAFDLASGSHSARIDDTVELRPQEDHHHGRRQSAV